MSVVDVMVGVAPGNKAVGLMERFACNAKSVVQVQTV